MSDNGGNRISKQTDRHTARASMNNNDDDEDDDMNKKPPAKDGDMNKKPPAKTRTSNRLVKLYSDDDEEQEEERDEPQALFQDSYKDRARNNAMDRTPVAQLLTRVSKERDELLLELQSEKKSHALLQDSYERINVMYRSEIEAERKKVEVLFKENNDLTKEVGRLMVAISSSKGLVGEISSEKASRVKKMVLEKLWWGTKFIECQEDLIAETTRIADMMEFPTAEEKTKFVTTYAPVVLEGFNSERQYANNGLFDAAKGTSIYSMLLIVVLYCTSNYSVCIRVHEGTRREIAYSSGMFGC